MDQFDREQQEKEQLKRFIKPILCCIAAAAAVGIIYPLTIGKDKASEEEDAEATETVVYESEDEEAAEDSETEEEGDSSEKQSIYDADLEDSEIVQDEISGNTATKYLGDIEITYNPELAESGSGYVSAFDMDIIYFHDGEIANTYACIVAANMWDEIDDTAELLSIDEAQDAVGEYVSNNSTALSEWEEDEDWYVWRMSYYEDGYSYVYYMLVPRAKRVSDWLYMGAYMMVETSDGTYKGVTTSESNFNIIQTALCSLIPESEFLAVSYDDLCERLQEILTNQTASGNGVMDGLSTLQKNNEAYLENKYGVDSIYDLDDMTEEEKEAAAEENKVVY